jgi:cytochrome P450
MASTQDTGAEYLEHPFLAGPDQRRVQTYGDVDALLKSKAFVAAPADLTTALIGDTLITLRGDEHLDRRRLEQALFEKDALRDYETRLLVPIIDRCLRRLERGSDGVVRADLIRLVRIMLLEISAAVVGLDVGDDAENPHLRDVLDGINDGVQAQWATSDQDAQLARGLRAKEALVADVLAPAWRRRAALLEAFRAGNLARSDLPRDLLMLLLERQAEDETLTDDTIVRECILYLVASVDTSVHAVTHVVTELESWLEQHPEDRERLGDPDFLRLATEEALRLHPPAPAVVRHATDDFDLPSGACVKRGERAWCDLLVSNVDESVIGSDPERFDLSRQINARVPRYGHSFGAGHHVCIGRVLALGDRKAGTRGSVVRILDALYRAGVERDLESVSTRLESVSDKYAAFVVRLPRL